MQAELRALRDFQSKSIDTFVHSIHDMARTGPAAPATAPPPGARIYTPASIASGLGCVGRGKGCSAFACTRGLSARQPTTPLCSGSPGRHGTRELHRPPLATTGYDGWQDELNARVRRVTNVRGQGSGANAVLIADWRDEEPAFAHPGALIGLLASRGRLCKSFLWACRAGSHEHAHGIRSGTDLYRKLLTCSY